MSNFSGVCTDLAQLRGDVFRVKEGKAMAAVCSS